MCSILSIVGNRTGKIRTYIASEELADKRRRHIAGCAIRVFYKNGYHKTSMRELASACGMTIGAIYSYIGSKDDILHLILQELVDEQNIMEPLYKDLKGKSYSEKLKVCFAKYLQVLDSMQDLQLFLVREIINFSSEDRAILLAANEYTLGFFENLLLNGSKDGEFRIDNPRLVALTIYALSQSWVRERWALRKLFTLEEYARQQSEFILQAIRRD